MKKINWKIFNAALWFEIVLAYLLPFKTEDNFCYDVGYPFPFLSVYDTKLGVSPFASMSVNPVSLLGNVVIFYFIIVLALKLYHKLRPAPACEEEILQA